MNENDLIRFQHMRDAALEALDYVEGETRESLDENSMLARALTACIGIIGEAAMQISPEIKEAYPEIPWPQIVGMRNRLIHVYFDINLDRVWSTVTEDLPLLIEQINRIMIDADQAE